LSGRKAKDNLPFGHRLLVLFVEADDKSFARLASFKFCLIFLKAIAFYVLRRLSAKHKGNYLCDLCAFAVIIIFLLPNDSKPNDL
jgi:hypothetical protein